MTELLHIESGELTTAEIMSAIESGSRVVVSAAMLGGSHTVSLRHDGEVYYCDTPTTLHKHTNPDEMRECIEKMGYSSSS
jgi:hemin uptake protein HemP